MSEARGRSEEHDVQHALPRTTNLEINASVALRRTNGLRKRPQEREIDLET